MNFKMKSEIVALEGLSIRFAFIYNRYKTKNTKEKKNFLRFISLKCIVLMHIFRKERSFGFPNVQN